MTLFRPRRTPSADPVSRWAGALVWALPALALLVALDGCTAIGSGPAPRPSQTTQIRQASGSPSRQGSGASAPVTQRNPGWALDRIDQHRRPLDRRFTVADQGRGVTVYVVDGLFDVHNAEFGGRASVGLALGETCYLEDGINHGLFVAGLVAGRRTGVAKHARIVSVGDSYGCEGSSGNVTDAQLNARIVRALDWVTDHARRPAVVNLSMNTDAPAPQVAAAVERLVQRGITVVASAGNDGDDACRHPPAGVPGVITVAASTTSDTDAGLNHGRCVDLFAPGQAVTSVVDAGLIPSRRATSQEVASSWAAPLASGTVALYLAAHPQATPAQARAWLLDNASRGVLRGTLHGSPNRLLFTGGPP